MKRPSGFFPAVLAALAAVALAACGGGSAVEVGAPPSAYAAPKAAPGSLALSTATPVSLPVDAQITSALVDLAQNDAGFTRDLSTAAAGTPESDILQLGSPMGYNLRNRYLNIGIPLAEAFAGNTDPVFRRQLVEMARWSRDSEARSSALIALARWHDPADLQIFNEALINLDPGVRFAALESLVVWGHKRDAEVLLAAASEKDTEPILRVYAAAGLARLGDPSGLARLRQFLTSPSWLVKAMAAQYIGDYGTAEDYDILLNRLDGETGNDFVVAEFCVSALKLYPKKETAEKKSEALRPRRAPTVPTGNLVLDRAVAYELDPLVVTAPRIRAQKEMIDPRINQQLLRLLDQRMDARPDAAAALDASIGNLNKLTTLDGYNLKTRYTELGFLLTEGLAGTTDYQLQAELEKAVRQGTNVQTRAAALVALAYTKDLSYLPLIQSETNDPNITLRFAALESLLVLGDDSAELQVANMARLDSSMPIRIYAAAAMWRMGDIFGREILLQLYQNPDWFVRAMSDHYLGELGGADEYLRLQQELGGEQDPAVRAEILDALVKLNPKKDQ
ncbi:MAG: HEAT repeat domain-containing protein [Elusimicrobia bacterium]|nr:HEAT repeat domain-containing protein [Elusimicrobiota bacterium]